MASKKASKNKKTSAAKVSTLKDSRAKKPALDWRWLAMIVLCLGTLMIVLDTTIVNVALPSIHTDLGFTESSLAWVINAYILVFGGFLLLGGRLGDLYGHRKLFMIGIGIFTVASLVCGLSNSQEMLLIARAVQGLGGAIVSAVSLSLVVNLFTQPQERAKAMGIFGFIAAGGGSIGVVLGGFLINTFDWHSIFLVNIPVGILVIALSYFLLPKKHTRAEGVHLDMWGALTVTAALLIAVYAIVNGNVAGWLSIVTLGLLAVAIVLLVVFTFVESKVKSPLVPLSMFKEKTFTGASAIGVLWAGSMFAWFFLSALYFQVILQYTPLKVGLAFLPANLIMAVCSLWISAKLVMRFGIRLPLAAGMVLAASGLLLLSIAPANASFYVNILPSMVLLGFGAGIAFNPLLLAAMGSVKPSESGLASGVVNTCFMMGGALGLAVLASLAASKTAELLANGSDQATALLGGYHLAFLVGAGFALLAAVFAWTLLKNAKVTAEAMKEAH